MDRIQGRLGIFGLSIKNFATFSVIRNPFAWHASWFTYIRGPKGGKRSGYHIENELFKKMTFSDYVDWLENPMAIKSRMFDMGKQVSDWVIDEQGKIAVDHILKQETLVDDLMELIKIHNLMLRLPKKTVNVSNKTQRYQDFYSANDVDKIATRHQKDIKLFGYSFEPTK